MQRKQSGRLVPRAWCPRAMMMRFFVIGKTFFLWEFFHIIIVFGVEKSNDFVIQ